MTKRMVDREINDGSEYRMTGGWRVQGYSGEWGDDGQVDGGPRIQY